MVNRKSQKTDKRESETARTTIATQTAINTEKEIKKSRSSQVDYSHTNSNKHQSWNRNCQNDYNYPNEQPHGDHNSRKRNPDQPLGTQRMSTGRNNTQRGAPDDDNFVTARDQSQRNNGWSSSNSGEIHRNRGGHAAIPPKTPASTGGSYNRRSYKEGSKPTSTDQFRKKARDWKAIKAFYGQYWFDIRNRHHVREDCSLIDERIVIPSQLRQTVLYSLHLTHPGLAAMLDLSHHVWFPHFHRSIVQMAQNCKTARSKVKT